MRLAARRKNALIVRMPASAVVTPACGGGGSSGGAGRRRLAGALGVWLAAALLTFGVAARGAEVVVDESGFFRNYNCLGVNRYSPELLRNEGPKILTKAGFDRLQRDTERWLQQTGQDPKKVDWTEQVQLLTYANFSPAPVPPPPADWTSERFDDSGWVLRRRPFQGSRPADITQPIMGQNDETNDVGLLHSYYRVRLVVDGAAEDLTLTARYHGGFIAWVNGQEVARGNIVADAAGGELVGADYPQKAYDPDGAALRERALAAVTIPGKLLHPGVNILAIAVHASRLHPVVLNTPRQPNWGGSTARPWPHGKLVKLEVRGGNQVHSAVVRPAGVQVWAADIHRRSETGDFLPPGEAVGVVRWVGARNGTYGAQLVVGTDKALGEIGVTAGELKQVDGAGVIPAAAIRVLHTLPFPEDQWTMARMGDERGLNATFPDAKTLASYAALPGGKVYMFDRLTTESPKATPANTSRPVWLSLMVPAQAPAGRYQGTVKVTAGAVTADLPMELTVVDWNLPQPRDFRTFVGCEENPYGVAKQYGVKPWSPEHWRLVGKSLEQLGRVGNKWVNIPVLVQTEYSNGNDSLIGWTRKKDRTWAFNYQGLDRYLELVDRYCGPPRVVNFVVMQGMKSQLKPPVAGRVAFVDEATGRAGLWDVDTQGRPPEVVAAWTAFAQSLAAHMKDKDLGRAMYWGHPLEAEADPELKNVLAAAVPDVYWIAGPHEMMSNGTFAKAEQFYKVVETCRYWGNWPSFRMDEGWRSKTLHLLNPRVGGTVFALHTTSLPFAYRVLPDHALAFGCSGFTRVGADEWAAVHYEGAAVAKWQTGVPVLFLLWPGPDGAQSSTRFEVLLEGIQETEARIFVEQAVERGGLPAELAARAQQVLADNLQETKFFQGNSTIHAYEEYYYRWQERSARVYAVAAEVAKAGKN